MPPRVATKGGIPWARGLWGLLFFGFFSICVSAIEVPTLDGPVVDSARILSAAERQELSSYLSGVSEQTGVQIAVLTLTSLEGEVLEDYSIRVSEKWKLGQAGQDNGVLLLVSVKDRAIRIEVGYGLEDKLTDAASGLIIRNVLAPRFRAGDYGKGMLEAAQTIAGIATGNAAIVPESVNETSDTSSGGGLGGMIFFLIFLFLILPRLRGRGILGPLILGSMLSSGRRSGWSSGSGGGFSGGGFSGGGGGFGGGGASGGW